MELIWKNKIKIIIQIKIQKVIKTQNYVTIIMI